DGDVEIIERFAAHARAMEKSMPWINEASQAHKDSLNEMQNQYRRVSYALLKLITGYDAGEDCECINDEGAWCWRDGCNVCLSLTKAIQSTAESMQVIADMYDSHKKEVIIPWIENFKEYNQPATNCEQLIDMHAGAYKKYKDVSDEDISQDQSEDTDIEAIRSRCDTVFNVTLSEVNRIHDEQLRQARANFDEPHYSALSQTPRTPSQYNASIDEQRPSISRPVSIVSVGSMSGMVGGVVDGVGSMGSFLKKTARTSIGSSSMFDSWWGRG
ncbi:14712_t:CDS:2, partial [Dentiscutata erythropus]